MTGRVVRLSLVLCFAAALILAGTTYFIKPGPQDLGISISDHDGQFTPPLTVSRGAGLLAWHPVNNPNDQESGVDVSASNNGASGQTKSDPAQYKIETAMAGSANISEAAGLAEVWVNDDWAGLEPGGNVSGHTIGYDAFARIQDGIDAVTSPGTVLVAEGSYFEEVVIEGTGNLNKNIQLLGGYSSGFSARDPGKYISTINGGGTANAVSVISGSGSSISGFDIIGGKGAGLSIIESDVIVRNNNIWNNTGTGLYVSDQTHCSIEDNRIHGNIGFGINLKLDSSVIRHNEIWGNRGGGIAVYEGGPPTIESNTIRDNNGHGISGGEAKAAIRDNTITGNSGSGVLGFQHGGTVSGNTILDNDCWGVCVLHGEIENNVIAENGLGDIDNMR